ncbi:alpha/beta fold hydrolase [Kribbella sp. CA-293567]|uniref:alpha/beta fold hydrolase n=1 Tax=Kribbella sp. CA-293567 TaxID=3002436 RepID=UPI0022DD612F|nr:alpha/beta hydrolase [Kribbella sp. CA-293567]WBQ08408.1 alpha/beta hydrolase [Kribbella sp. CA-293567]
MAIAPSGATVPGVTHHNVDVNGTTLHYVSSGDAGSPVVLVHGFPETWWVFHKLIPLLSRQHRVFAVDLRGFGDSAIAGDDHSSSIAAADLREFIAALEVGPVHLTGQDVAGATTFRVAAADPTLVKSFTAIETGLPGFGVEVLGDVTRGGAWHLGVLAAPGIADMLLPGRERAFFADYAIPTMNGTPDAFTSDDLEELLRSYSRPNAWAGAVGLYRSLLSEGEEIKALAARKLDLPVLAIGGSSGHFTPNTMAQVAADVTAVALDGIGHFVGMEAPHRLADALLTFYQGIDGRAD